MKFLYPLQWFLIKVLNLILYAYFQEIRVIGESNIPKWGPVIIVGNHPNMALDPVIISCVAGRLGLHFWAKSGLFSSPWSNWLMRGVGAVPVYRAMDVKPGEKPRSNEQLYEASYEVFENGEVLILFPEGTSYTATKLQPLKKGVGWLVKGYYDQTGLSVPVVPAGINYTKKDKWRSEVLVEFGPPIHCFQDEGDGQLSSREQVDRATHLIETAMEALVVNADDWDAMGMLRTARRIYASGHQLSLHEHVRLQRKFNQLYSQLKGEPAVQQVVARVDRYHQQLKDMRLHDAVVASDLSAAQIARTAVSSAVQLALLLPLALPGLLLHSPIYLLTKLLHVTSKHVEDRSMIKMGILFLALPLFNLTFMLLAYFAFDGSWLWTLVMSAGLLLFQYLHLMFLEQGVETGRSLVWLTRLLFSWFLKRSAVQQLKQDRAAIKRQLDQLAVQYVPEDERIIDHEKTTSNSSASSAKRPSIDHDDKYI